MALFSAARLRTISRLRQLSGQRLFSWRANAEQKINSGGISKVSDAAPLGTHTPPLAIRSLLVGSATALATPLFPVIGFNAVMLRYLDPAQRLAVTGGSSLLMFSAMTLVPNAFYYAPLLLPFAVGNGITSAALYTISDRCAGGPVNLAEYKIGPVPLFGPAVGVATAFAAPFTYPVCWALVWPESSAGEAIMETELYNAIFGLCTEPFVVFLLGTTGAAAGGLLHLGLRPLVVGVPGFDWNKLAGTYQHHPVLLCPIARLSI